MKLAVNVPVIVLAGGFGTRLRHVVQDVPKPMAPINTRPFLELLFDYLIEQSIREVILATGHQADIIQQYFGDSYHSLSISYSHEEAPLGTGGAIKQAFEKFDLSEAFVINGDTFFPVSLGRLYYFHHQFNADVTLAIKYMRDFNRYGTLTWNAYNEIEAFHEKVGKSEGWINGGIYVIHRSLIEGIPDDSFSFETAVLEAQVATKKFYAIPFSDYFIDIGVPADYALFQHEMGVEEVKSVATNSTLFIDRDGVINTRIPGDYVRSPEDFYFLAGALEALAILSRLYDHLVIVTNQQGIGKGLMTNDDLKRVHDYMLAELAKTDVQVDAVQYCPNLAIELPPNRKPNIGMALAAKSLIPDINWGNATMVGDSTSDIEFGLRMGMQTILVGDKSDTQLAHDRYDDLLEFASRDCEDRLAVR